MKMKQAIRDYLTAHRVNNDSADTLNTYRYLLPRFADWLASKGRTDTDELRIHHLREWVVYLKEKPVRHSGKKMKDTTVQMYSKQVLAFCHRLEQEEIIEKPITARFKLPHVEKQFIPTLVPRAVLSSSVQEVHGDDATGNGAQPFRCPAANGAYVVDNDEPLCFTYSRASETVA